MSVEIVNPDPIVFHVLRTTASAGARWRSTPAARQLRIESSARHVAFACWLVSLRRVMRQLEFPN